MYPVLRPAGSPAEALAARRLTHAFHTALMPATPLPARAPAIPHLAELVTAPLLLAALLIGVLQPILGFILVVLAFGLYAIELHGSGWIARFAPAVETVSVLAAMPAQHEDVRRVIVVTALDSPPQPSVLDRNKHLSQPLPRICAGAALLGAAALVLDILFSSSFPMVLVVIAAAALVGMLVLVALPVLRPAATTDESHASNVLGALVEFGSQIRAQPARWVDVWCFAAGGGAVSGQTLRTLLQENALDPASTFVINITEDGGASMAFSEGTLWQRRSAPTLIRIASKVTSAEPAQCGPDSALSATAAWLGYQVLTLNVRSDSANGADLTLSTLPEVLHQIVSTVDSELVQRHRVTRLARARTGRATQSPRSPRL